jgi:hypothetical protein
VTDVPFDRCGAEIRPARTGALTAALVALVVIGGAAAVSAQPPAADTDAVRQFTAATRDYAQMHRRLEQQIGPIAITTSIDEINRNIQQLAAAIRAERGDAKQGDFFTPALGRQLRASISEALQAHDFTADDVITAARVDGVDYQRVALRVNGTFPWALGGAMIPCVIHALPELPPELQYRIVGHDLVLIDVHASLIVDMLPSVLTWETER